MTRQLVTSREVEALAIGTLIAFWLTACGAPPAIDTPPATEELMAETEISVPLPTVTPVTPLPENLPPGLPANFTPQELAAAQAGQAAYSGYSCSLTADTCVCDQPIIHSVTFTFQPGNHLSYQFAGETYGATWDMTRLAPNQWSYTLKIGSGETNATPEESGGYFFLLTFTDAGFTMVQREERGGGESVTCPEAAFTRMSNP